MLRSRSHTLPECNGEHGALTPQRAAATLEFLFVHGLHRTRHRLPEGSLLGSVHERQSCKLVGFLGGKTVQSRGPCSCIKIACTVAQMREAADDGCDRCGMTHAQRSIECAQCCAATSALAFQKKMQSCAIERTQRRHGGPILRLALPVRGIGLAGFWGTSARPFRNARYRSRRRSRSSSQ